MQKSIKIERVLRRLFTQISQILKQIKNGIENFGCKSCLWVIIFRLFTIESPHKTNKSVISNQSSFEWRSALWIHLNDSDSCLQFLWSFQKVSRSELPSRPFHLVRVCCVLGKCDTNCYFERLAMTSLHFLEARPSEVYIYK